MSQKQKILIVEDDEFIRDIYKEVLGGAGFDITTGVDGEDGLMKILEGGFDLILLDLMMPKLDGFGVLKQLQGKTPKEKNGPIVLLTNLAHDNVLKDAMALGAKSYLIKSDLNPEQLTEKVSAFLH